MSGISISIFNNFNTHNIKLNLEKLVDQYVRKFYYGGRCEVFGNNEENEKIFHFDFSGMYSNRLLENFSFNDYELIYDNFNINIPGFYTIFVNSDLELPILPYKCKKTKKLLFPNGEFYGTYWYQEIIIFIKNGGIILKIIDGLVFKKTDYIFKNFALNCIKQRKLSKINNIIWKMIPNSLVGRLGLRQDNEETVLIENNLYDPTDIRIISDKKINNIWVVRKKKEINNIINSNVIYASIVTSKARIIWWEQAKNLINAGGRLLYCDTDSIFVAFKWDVSNKKFDKIFFDSLKEDTLIEDACFASSKCYSIKYKNNTKIKIKGVNKKLLIKENFCDFKKSFYNEQNINFSTDYFKKINLNVKILNIIKTINLNSYDKRIFDKNKKYTKSIKLKENTLFNDENLYIWNEHRWAYSNNKMYKI